MHTCQLQGGHHHVTGNVTGWTVSPNSHTEVLISSTQKVTVFGAGPLQR